MFYTMPHEAYNRYYDYPDLDQEVLSELLGIRPPRFYQQQQQRRACVPRTMSCPWGQRWRGPQQWGNASCSTAPAMRRGCRPMCQGPSRRPEARTTSWLSDLLRSLSSDESHDEKITKDVKHEEKETNSGSGNGEENGWQQHLKLPGFSPEDVTIKANPDSHTITVRATQKKEKDGGYQYREVRRAVSVPKDIPLEDVKSKYDPTSSSLVFTASQQQDGLTSQASDAALEMKDSEESHTTSKDENKKTCDKKKQNSRSVPVCVGYHPWFGPVMMFVSEEAEKENLGCKKEEKEMVSGTQEEKDYVESECEKVQQVEKESDEIKDSDVRTTSADEGVKSDIKNPESADVENEDNVTTTTEDNEVDIDSESNTDSIEVVSEIESAIKDTHFENAENQTSDVQEKVDEQNDGSFEMVEASDVTETQTDSADHEEISESVPVAETDSGQSVMDDDEVSTPSQSEAENPGFKFEVNVSGYDPENIHVTLEGSRVTVQAQQEVEEDGAQVSQSIRRSHVLPDHVDTDQLQCRLVENKLHLSAPRKLEERKPRSIQVQQL